VAEADGNRKTAEELIDFAQTKFMTLRRSSVDTGLSMGDLFGSYMPRLDGMRDGTIQPAWKSDIAAVRDVLPFLEDTDYLVIASRPGGGKSTILRLEARAAAKVGKHVAIFNLENDPYEYARHMISMELGMDNTLLKDPKRLNPEQLEQIREASKVLAKLPIRLIHAAGWSANDVVRVGKKLVADGMLDDMMVDYIQLLSNGGDNAQADIEISSKTLRTFALQMRKPTFAAAQLNRAVDARKKEDEALLSDLRGSGSLESDATVVWFPKCPWSLTTPTPEQLRVFPENAKKDQAGRIIGYVPRCVPVRINQVKNRNGTVGVSGWIKWDRATNRMISLDNSFSA
jgi:replicative DNA helicase